MCIRTFLENTIRLTTRQICDTCSTAGTTGCRATWRKVVKAKHFRSPIWCPKCSSTRKHCSFHDQSWGVSRWPLIFDKDNKFFCLEYGGDCPPPPNPPDLPIPPNPKRLKVAPIVTRSHSEGSPLPLKNPPASSPLNPQPPFSSLVSLDLSSSFSMSSLVDLLQESKDSEYTLADSIANVRAVRDRAEYELNVSTDFVKRRLSVVDRLLEEYEGQLENLRSQKKPGPSNPSQTRDLAENLAAFGLSSKSATRPPSGNEDDQDIDIDGIFEQAASTTPAPGGDAMEDES